MDLLFYCPFDFTQYLGEDFLKSSESYLMKKLRRKTNANNNDQEGSDDDMDGLHDGSFESQASNDSAKKIKAKIEDSKKLLDLAANIKGLNLDPEKKREFMKLLIDFDQKYGDHDLVDALEQDVTENMKDEAVIIKNLATTLKNKLQKDGQDVDDDLNASPDGKSSDSKNNKKPGDATKNPTSITNIKGKPDNASKDQTTAGKNKKGGETPSNANGTKGQNRKDGNVSISKKDGSPTRDNKLGRFGDGDTSDGDSPNTSMTKQKNKGRDQDDTNTFITSSKTKVKSIVGDLQGLKEERGDKENNSRVDIDAVDESPYGKQIGSKADTSPSKASSKSKYVLDENGKIIFTSKKTQELLEGIADEASSSTKRKRGDTKGFSSKEGSVEGEGDAARSSLGYLGLQSQAFDDHEVVYQEIINEKGERILVPINVKTNSKRDASKTRGSVSPGKSDHDHSKSPVDLDGSKGESHKMVNSSSSKGLIKGPSLRRLPGQGSRDNLAEGGPLPMIIGSSFKPPGSEKKGFYGGGDGTFDPNILIESLMRYDPNDSQYKEERRREEIESALRFSHADDSKVRLVNKFLCLSFIAW